MRPTILFVDDEKAICSAMRRSFYNMPYKIYEAYNAEQALHLMSQVNIDVVVSDQRMPGMSGTELLTQVKNLYPQAGRIILSGQCEIEDMANAINEAKINHFVCKPWDDNRLISIINDNLPKNNQDHIMDPTIEKFSDGSLMPLNGINVSEVAVDLQRSIKNNALNLKSKNLQANRDKLKPLHYLEISWPDYLQFQHEHIVNIARKSSFIGDLYCWYLHSCNDYLDASGPRDDNLVIDFFSEGFETNQDHQDLLKTILNKHKNIILRVPFRRLRQNFLGELLLSTDHSSYRIMLSLGQREIDVKGVVGTPIRYLEINCDPCSMSTNSLNKHKVIMALEARSSNISTILINGSNQPTSIIQEFDYL